MAVIAQTTEQRQVAQGKLGAIIQAGRAKAAQGLEAMQREFKMRKDLRVRPGAIDIETVESDGGFKWRPVVVDKKAGTRVAFEMTGHARGQFLSRAGIPGAFVDTLVQHGQAELLRENILKVLPHESADGLLVRTVGDTAKAFLSPAYKCLDNALFFDTFVEESLKAKLVPYRGEVSDTRGFLSFLRPEIVEIAPGEFVVPGVEMRGSDYGNGAQELNAMFLRLLCLNGAVGYDMFRKIHIGRRFSSAEYGEDNVIKLSQKTIELDVSTVRSALSDTMKGVTKHLDALTESLREAATKEINVESTISVLKKKGLKTASLAKVKALYENEALPVEALPAGQGAWRLSNALSLLANATSDVDEAADLRDAAYAVLPMPKA
jgi:hypothetical protein